MSDRLAEVLAWIEASADAGERAKLARYGIPDDRACGIAMREMQARAKVLGRDQALAEALWATGGYEARTLAAMVADPAAFDRAMMDGWAGDFDSWAICDTVCFRLFDRCAPAFGCPPDWATAEPVYLRRAGFALVWALALHNKAADDAAFTGFLALIEAADPKGEAHVAKAMAMALKAVGRRSDGLRAAALALGRAMTAEPGRDRARIGRDAVKTLGA